MPGDDLLSQIQYVSDNAKKFFNDILNGGHATEEAIVGALRDGVDQLNHVLGYNLEIPGLSKPASAIQPIPGTGQKISDWVTRNRGKSALIVAALFAGAVGAGVAFSRSRARRSSRKARRTKHGARKEVVVLIGNPGYTTMMRSIALDLEIRGFIIYVVVSSHEDSVSVQREGRSDIIAMPVNGLDPSSMQENIQQFHDFLNSKQQAMSSGPRHQLELCGIVVVPQVTGTVKRMDRIPSDTWNEFMSIRVNNTITTITSFLPLAIEHQARIVVLTSTIVHSVTPPLHSMEATAVGALEAYTKCLRRELSPSGVIVSQLKLGSFDFGALEHGLQAQRTRNIKSSSPSQLHDAVFDALTMKGAIRSQYVGRGASLYGAIGDYAPTSLIDWLISRKAGRTSALLT